MTKMTPDQIDKALKAGIIDASQAKDMMAKLDVNAPKPDQAALIGDEENMRFVRSFSDVFIATGIGLLSMGLYASVGIFGAIVKVEWVGYLVGAGLIWLMCEYFGRIKRAHLPTLLLALAYLLFVHKGVSNLLDFSAQLAVVAGIVPAVITILAMLLFYWRFKLPFSVALIAISLVILVFALLGGTIPTGILLLLSGLALFGTALSYDARDTDRKTRFADNAFWLHFTAAPLIIHGFAIQVLTPEVIKIGGVIPMVQLGKADAAFMLLTIGLLALVGLAINRRALLVSSLGYAGFAIGFLIKDTGLNLGSVVALTLLILGGGIVFLGVGWHGARKALLKVLPTSGFMAKIFPPSG
ncbi:MAG: hypothetical protein COA91_05490 [Robiginitomaculum sp.]|nr:MAG: hypothetical protein COA91_05490 [Robiginitomaculum sp.]